MQKQQVIGNLPLRIVVVCSNDIHSQLQENERVSTLFDFCNKSFPRREPYLRPIPGKDLCKSNNTELTPSYCGVCSNDIHSQLQGNEQAFTLFDFWINPSHEDSIRIVYYEGYTCCIIPSWYRSQLPSWEGFMQKSKRVES